MTHQKPLLRWELTHSEASHKIPKKNRKNKPDHLSSLRRSLLEQVEASLPRNKPNLEPRMPKPHKQDLLRQQEPSYLMQIHNKGDQKIPKCRNGKRTSGKGLWKIFLLSGITKYRETSRSSTRAPSNYKHMSLSSFSSLARLKKYRKLALGWWKDIKLTFGSLTPFSLNK